MAHDKVYGICENKCAAEVITKDNICVLAGELAAYTRDSLKYPTGWSVKNTIVLSVMSSKTSGFWYMYPAIDLTQSDRVFDFYLNSSAPWINNRSSDTVYYKIVLYKHA